MAGRHHRPCGPASSPTGRCLARSDARRGSIRSPALSVGWLRIDGQHQRSGARPKTSSVGIMNSLSPWNPRPPRPPPPPLPGTTMRQPGPSGSLMPAASMTRPLMRRPETSSGQLERRARTGELARVGEVACHTGRAGAHSSRRHSRRHCQVRDDASPTSLEVASPGGFRRAVGRQPPRLI